MVDSVLFRVFLGIFAHEWLLRRQEIGYNEYSTWFQD